eukprot:5912720-Pyramimonas_sp.AAC.1
MPSGAEEWGPSGRTSLATFRALPGAAAPNSDASKQLLPPVPARAPRQVSERFWTSVFADMAATHAVAKVPPCGVDGV